MSTSPPVADQGSQLWHGTGQRVACFASLSQRRTHTGSCHFRRHAGRLGHRAAGGRGAGAGAAGFRRLHGSPVHWAGTDAPGCVLEGCGQCCTKLQCALPQNEGFSLASTCRCCSWLVVSAACCSVGSAIQACQVGPDACCCMPQVFGGRVVRAPCGVMHGKTSAIHHTSVGLMQVRCQGFVKV